MQCRNEPNLDFCAGATQRGYQPGASVDLTASLTEYGVPFAGSAHVWAEVTLPSGVSTRVNLHPTGAGAYAATFITMMMGQYVCRIRAAGATSRDVRFTRETTATAGVWLSDDRPAATKAKQSGAFGRVLECLFGRRARR